MIAIVIRSLGRGGAERSTLELVRGLEERKVDFRLVVLANDGPECAGPMVHGAKIIRIDAPSFFEAIIPLYSELKRLMPDAIYSVMPHASLASTLCSKLLNIPLITSERTTPRLFYRSHLKRWVALLSHALSQRSVFISQFAIDRGLGDSFFARIIKGKAIVIHNPVSCPISEFESLSSRNRKMENLGRFLGIDGSADCDSSRKCRFLVASRLVAGKGLSEFLKDAAGFICRHDIEFVIAGEGPLRGKLEKQLDELNIAAKVRFTGYVADIWALYAQADVVILPSESEGFGRVGFEAYQAGCLVVGLPNNSFVPEVIVRSPAWTVVPNFRNLEGALMRFLYEREEIEHSQDLEGMRRTLSIDAHVTKFLSMAMKGYLPS